MTTEHEMGECCLDGTCACSDAHGKDARVRRCLLCRFIFGYPRDRHTTWHHLRKGV